MNKYVRTLIFLLSSIGVSQNLWAEVPPEPEGCPDILAIKKAKLSVVQLNSAGNFDALHLSPYNTIYKWQFTIWDIPAQTAEEARNKAHQILANLMGHPKPILDISESLTWSCHYISYAGYSATAALIY